MPTTSTSSPHGPAANASARPQESTGTHRLSTSIIGLLWAIGWTVTNLSWVASDHLLRDGDEEGHVGAAELFRADLAGGHPLDWLARAWAGDMGDYPSLYPALTGGWWWLGGHGQPGDVQVRAIGLAWPLIAAAAAAALASRSRLPNAALLAFIATTLLPLPVALARHFMPEGMLVCATVLAVLAAVRAAERPGWLRAVVLGLAVGAGLLIKQTFLLVGLPGVLAALALTLPDHSAKTTPSVRAPTKLAISLVAALAAAGVAAPWYLSQAQRQLAYLSGSALTHSAPHSIAHAATVDALAAALALADTLLSHALWYPVAALVLVVGPIITAMAVVGGGAAWLRLPHRHPGRRMAAIAVLWAALSTGLLTLVPKKYPRLLAPVAPAAAILVGVGLAGRKRGPASGALLVIAGGASLWTLSTRQAPDLPGRFQGLVPGCPQHWLRPAVADDLGMAAVADLLAAAPPGPVRIDGGPDISCALQTTAPWAEHLGPYLRRRGQDRLVDPDPSHHVSTVITWVPDVASGTGSDPAGAGAGASAGSVPVPLLGGHFIVHNPSD